MLASFSEFIARYLPGKIQKISINAGFTCPNRDGSKGTGGCIYCNNASFSPDYALRPSDIAEQIERGKAFFARKYPRMRYLAYFQSYTSTNAPIANLISLYDQALADPQIDGIIIGTRPDCISPELLGRLAEIARTRFVMIEYGAESANDHTLQRINRCHTWADTVNAVRLTASLGIPVGLHLIIGLPGETREDIFRTIDAVNGLPVQTLKCHQMQVIRGTRLAQEYAAGTADLLDLTDPETYADLCVDILSRLRPDIAVERFVSQAPAELLIHPRWGLKNYQFTNLLRQRLTDQNP